MLNPIVSQHICFSWFGKNIFSMQLLFIRQLFDVGDEVEIKEDKVYKQYFCFVIFAFLFFPVSLFCDCKFSCPNPAYFNVNTTYSFPESNFSVGTSGECDAFFSWPCDGLTYESGDLPTGLNFFM